ncbi:hypothetical protein PHMEG_00015409 [Phytophthora megakarya]|uniref:Reverse transcriptase n=1 Tax=Phytophthora megakarya TaxID=4795 RepID=A0A225W1V3_9STRA|nr:hypothetical protein PHMEG_00015409 [Phytophthora megakarya]
MSVLKLISQAFVSDRCGCVADKLARHKARGVGPKTSTTGATVEGAEDLERLRSVVGLGEDPPISSGSEDPERQRPLRPVYFTSETNDDSQFVPEFASDDVLDSVLERAFDDFSDPMDDVSDPSDTPVQRLEREYERVMRVTVEKLDLEPAVNLRKGTELLALLSDHLTMFPELEELSPECDIDKTDVGVPGVTTPEMEDKMRKILSYHRRIFLGDGNAAPTSARGVVRDLRNANSTGCSADRLQLLETGLIEHSESKWSFPIVKEVLKKNGEDIRMLLNQLIKLSQYPLPLIDDLLTDFNAAACLCLPIRALPVDRIPFGLKNAPLVYPNVINNCLRGFVRLRPEEEVKVDRDVQEFLKPPVPDIGPTIQ